MPTFSISGVLVTRNSSDTVIEINPVTLNVVMPAGQTTFSYSILETFADDIPEVEISTNSVSASLSGPGVPAGLNIQSDDAFTSLGQIFSTEGNFVALAITIPRPGGGDFDAIFPIGGTVPAIPTTVAEFNALESTITGTGTATEAFAPGVDIDFNTLANTVFDASPNVILGTDGDDVLNGTPGDDFIVTGEATPSGDLVNASTGNDTIDMSGIEGGFVTINYAGLAGPINVTIDGGSVVGIVDKGAAGTDTLLGVTAPLNAGWTTGGLDIRGTGGDDIFDLAPQGEQWMSVRGGDGVDTYLINGTGLVRMDFRDAVQGIEIDLATRQIANDGFGNAETIGGTSPVFEVFGSGFNDTFTGSGANDSYRSFGGDNTLDGGGGLNRLRYDSPAIGSVTIDATAGTATGSLSGGGTFTDSFMNFQRLRGSNGNDEIIGSDGDDRLEGGNGDDTIAGGLGNDVILLGGGANTYIYSGGIDVLADFKLGIDSIIIDIPGLTQADVDAAFANPLVFEGTTFVDFGVPNENLNFGSLSVQGVSGINATVASGGSIPGVVINGGGAGELLVGTVGDDTINGGGGNDTIDGVAGNNVIDAGVGFDLVFGGSGDDYIRGFNGFDTLHGGPGNDTLMGNAGNDVLFGGDGDDVLNGGIGFDELHGGEGNDLLIGLEGFDTLFGGPGNDTLYGNAGNDVLHGGDGDDVLFGGIGADLMFGDAGDDHLRGQAGPDTLYGGQGHDTLEGNAGNDVLNGGSGHDLLLGGIGADTLDGGTGNDTLLGGRGHDLLIGGPGNDRLEGNSGNDTLDGGTGDDVLIGGLGADTFIFRLGYGNDRIADFQRRTDTVQLDAALLGGGTPDAQDLRDIARLNDDGFLVLDFGGGDTLTFTGITNTGAILDNVDFI